MLRRSNDTPYACRMNVLPVAKTRQFGAVTVRHSPGDVLQVFKPYTFGDSDIEAYKYAYGKHGLAYTKLMHGSMYDGPVNRVLGIDCDMPDPRQKVARMASSFKRLKLHDRVVEPYGNRHSDEIRLQICSDVDEYYFEPDLVPPGEPIPEAESMFAPMVYMCTCRQFPCLKRGPRGDQLVDNKDVPVKYWARVLYGSPRHSHLPEVFAVIMPREKSMMR